MKITTSTAPQIIERMRASGVLDSVRTYNSGGPGGQHANRSLNAVAIVATWRLVDGEGSPVGRLTARGSAALKSQAASRAAALRVLLADRERQLAALRQEAKAERRSGRSAQGFGGAGADRVRTYNAATDRVTDTSGFTASYRATVGKGSLRELIERRRVMK